MNLAFRIMSMVLIIVSGCTCSSNKRHTGARIEEKLVGKTAGEIFDYYNVGSKDLQMLDEPPGILSAVSFNERKGDRLEELYLWLNDQPPLVSDERLWDFESIRKVKVIKITHDPYN